MNYRTNWNMDCRRVLRGVHSGAAGVGAARGEGCWGLEVGGCKRGVRGRIIYICRGCQPDVRVVGGWKWGG